MKINPDKKLVLKIINAINKNGGYCPCALEKTEDTKCQCKEMMENNICQCGLFVK